MATMVDEYWGEGGTYLLDPATGKRTLIERTMPSVPDPQPEVTTHGPDLSQAPTSGEN